VASRYASFAGPNRRQHGVQNYRRPIHSLTALQARDRVLDGFAVAGFDLRAVLRSHGLGEAVLALDDLLRIAGVVAESTTC